jgi:ribonuclease P protein component
MLAKKFRLPTELIPIVARTGRLYRLSHFDVRVVPSSATTARFGVSISAKIDKRATVRNRIKRLLRAAAWELIKNQQLPVADYLVIVRSSELANLTAVEISRQLTNISAKSN